LPTPGTTMADGKRVYYTYYVGTYILLRVTRI